jgi:alkylated DNA nucleotide flippase Atl1
MGPTRPGGDGSFCNQVLACVAGIPKGRVMSYRGVAARAGSRAARALGRILAQYGEDVPWHRVVHADGTLAG